MSTLTLTEQLTPNTPAAGKQTVYLKADGLLYKKNAAGVESLLVGSSLAQSIVRLNTTNGYGSTNTTIRRFLNVVTNQGTDITYADSATLGASFTINANGIYAISYTDAFSATGGMVISLNSTQLASFGLTITVADRLAQAITSAADYPLTSAATLPLVVNDIIRAHAGPASSLLVERSGFIITRVA